jgi:hypothetical protein
MKFSHISIAFLALSLSGCGLLIKKETSVESKKIDNEATAVAKSQSGFNPDWVSKLGALKPAIRTCLVARKSTSIIYYAAPVDKGNAMIILGDASGKQSECKASLNKSSQPVIVASSYSIPKATPSFYPVGRSALKCTAPKIQRDQENRVMGTVCSSQ